MMFFYPRVAGERECLAENPHCYIEDSLQTEIVAWYIVYYHYYFRTPASSQTQHREGIE